MSIGSRVIYRGRMFTYMGESVVKEGMVSLYSNSGSIVVSKSMVRSI